MIELIIGKFLENKISKIHWIYIGRASRGWTCEYFGSIDVHTQCTRIRASCDDIGSSSTLFGAIIDGYRKWKKFVLIKNSEKGDFNND